MPHKVTIEKVSSELDEWGDSIKNHKTVEAKCKISYNTINEEITVASGESVVYTAQILLEGLPEVDYNDFITWTDYRGNEQSKHPIEVSYKFDLSGVPVALRVTV